MPEPQLSGAETSPAQGYDRLIQKLIPGYASLARLAVALLAASPLAGAEGSSILVAGCGTGAELLEARSQRPDWNLTASDPSARMLAVAQERLDGVESITWCQTRVEDLPSSHPFDGAIAVLVLQCLADDGAKLRFLSALARNLRPEAQLVLVDLMRPERSPLQAQVDRAWGGFQKASSLTPHSTALADLTYGLHPIGRARLTALVNAAGFSDPAPVFKALDFEGFLVQRVS